MQKLWCGLADGNIDECANIFNASITFDKRLYKYDILGSIAHAKMLGKCKIITEEEMKLIVEELEKILKEIESGKVEINEECEDIHTFVEQLLTERIGDAGKKVHTARSRNDQVALDLRMYTKEEINNIKQLIEELILSIETLAKENNNAIMPGYTHLQKAQPIKFAHELRAYIEMFKRDVERLTECYNRTNICPIGSCALAGTTYNIDRFYEADLLGFSKPCSNSIDGVSDRDFVIEFLSNASLLMMHISRFSEEIILWSSAEFNYISIDAKWTTGSSIMPQKKNADMFELARGKTGRVYGNLFTILTIMKSLPLAYNKDMQEDKECFFDSVDTIKISLKVFIPMIKSLKVKEDNMLKACKTGFINATDAADYLVSKNYSFRDAYRLTGQMVHYCIENNKTLDEMSIEEYKKFAPEIEEDIYNAIDISTCVQKRQSYGGTGYETY